MSTAITLTSAINLSLSPLPSNMRPQASTSKNLNPFAPEYNPISPGVAPNPHAPPPFFLPPPPTTAHRPPPSSPHLQPPLLLPHQIRNHTPSTSLHTPQHNFHSTYSTYVTFRNQVYTAPPRQRPPPPPTAATSVHCGQLEKGSTRRRRGHGRRRESTSWSERSGRISNINFERRVDVSERNCVGFSKHQQFSKPFLKNGENKHRTLPLNPHEEKTTVMIKNIPYECPRSEMINLLDDFCSLENQKAAAESSSAEEAAYAYDFLYLPIDFRSERSRGFAFVNFTTSRAVWKFFDSFHLKKWDFVERYMKWPKQIEIVRAQIQGKEALVKHFSESVFQCGTDEFLPVCFSPARDGSGQAVELTVVGNRRPAAHWGSRAPQSS